MTAALPGYRDPAAAIERRRAAAQRLRALRWPATVEVLCGGRLLRAGKTDIHRNQLVIWQRHGWVQASPARQVRGRWRVRLELTDEGREARHFGA